MRLAMMPFAVGGKSYPSGESLYLTMFPVKPVYSFVYTGPKMGKRKGTRDVASPLSIGSSGGLLCPPPTKWLDYPPILVFICSRGVLGASTGSRIAGTTVTSLVFALKT
jgi:hypothetical protein